MFHPPKRVMTAKNSGIEELDYLDRDFTADIDFLVLWGYQEKSSIAVKFYRYRNPPRVGFRNFE